MKNMKLRKLHGISLLLLPFLGVGGLLLSTGCDDFLERSAQNLIIPQTTAQYKEILQGDGYFRGLTTKVSTQIGDYSFLLYMTDDIEYFDAAQSGWTGGDAEESDVEKYSSCYRWDVSVENQSFTDRAYLYFYHQAMVANVCLEGIDESDGTEAEKAVLRGQAAFSRAFAYLMLATIYAKPYNKAKPEDLCVPLKVTSTPTTERYGRATIAQVWGQIVGDIETALQNLKGTNLEVNVYEISYPATLILATRIALYMEDWDKVIAYGEEFRTSYSRYPIYDISAKDTSGTRLTDMLGTVVKFISTENTEIVWNFGSVKTASYRNNIPHLTSLIDNMVRYFRVSSKEEGNLIGTYESGDRRKAYWFFPPLNSGSNTSYRFDYLTVKSDSYNQSMLRLNFALRTSEVYLSLAEAYARKPNPNQEAAVELLNALRVKRFNPLLYTPLGNFSANDELVKYIWAERRRELCFEEAHRWWDLRRIGPSIKHKWKKNSSNQNTYFMLEENDPAYVLNFPEAEIIFNGSALVPNRRPVRQPIPGN
jgi:hypothetical protein